MSTIIDDNREYINESAVSMWPTVVRFGVIGGVASLLYKYINYTTMFSTSSLGGMIAAFLLNLAIFGGLIYLAIRQHRDQELGGFITMGRCLAVGIMTVVIASVLGGIFDYVYVNFIDPDVTAKLSENMVWFYEMMGMDEDTIEDTLEAVAENQVQPNLLMSVGGAAFGGALTGLILSAILGAVMRKDQPVA